MGPYNKFSIINKIDKEQDYSKIRSTNYNLVKISDDYVGWWAEKLFDMPTFWHEINRPNHGLARYGVTLIPPESLPIFYEAVKKDKQVSEVKKLIEMIEVAIKENKYIIHFGI